MLAEAADVKTCPECNKCVLLLLDEMHVREDLVYDKHTGELIGFTNLGDINNHLDAYKKALSTDEKPPSLAKSGQVFMVRGLFTKLQFAYAQFPCSILTGGKLYKPFWDAVCRIESCGLKVSTDTHMHMHLHNVCMVFVHTYRYWELLWMAACSVNRRFIKMHGTGSTLTNKVANPFTSENRQLLFFSDPPHLPEIAWLPAREHSGYVDQIIMLLL